MSQKHRFNVTSFAMSGDRRETDIFVGRASVKRRFATRYIAHSKLLACYVTSLAICTAA